MAMKIDLLGLIINNAPRGFFDGLMIDNGKELDAEHSLDYMIMEYAKVRAGGTSDTIVVRDIDRPASNAPPPQPGN